MEFTKVLETVSNGERKLIDLSGGPEARKITVEMRKLNPEDPRPPKRSESPPVAHEFLSAVSLGDFLGRYGCAATVVFADVLAEKIHAVLDQKAKDGFQVVVMTPQIHPLWKPWAELAGRWIDVKEFAGFVAQNRRSVAFPDGRELALTLSQVRASVAVEIQTGRGKSAVNSLSVRTRIQGGTEQSDVVELPETIRLNVPLYVDTDAVDVELDLCIEASAEGKVAVIVSSGMVAEARFKAFENMVAAVKARAPAEAIVSFGRPKHESWDYLPELDGE
jgi:hypothetical protein